MLYNIFKWNTAALMVAFWYKVCSLIALLIVKTSHYKVFECNLYNSFTVFLNYLILIQNVYNYNFAVAINCNKYLPINFQIVSKKKNKQIL